MCSFQIFVELVSISSAQNFLIRNLQREKKLRNRKFSIFSSKLGIDV